MPCKCHRVVCEEHAAEFRPFEEPCQDVHDEEPPSDAAEYLTQAAAADKAAI